ncbi:MAG: valine--tRNA ligase [Candidatus Cloacimonadota bacterium]|nr:MAG: valine--tRNA ligase [Candidatus Cloacimonadota bacterium]
MEINKTYNPSEIEKKWYKYWMDNKMFSPSEKREKAPFTVIIPPPNVTGILHMGHVLNNTNQDIMIRYKRMTGVPTLWIPGVDHAGIATQNVVEKQIAQEGKTRHDIGREDLVKRIWAWKEEKGGRIIEQLKQLGCSCDWDRERFTMDEGLSEAVKEVFIRLYEKGLIYRGKRIINWCPRCVTALANDEVEHNDEDGHFWHIKYPYADGEGFVEIATTRPETMLGDVAVAVHPEDERYKSLIGKELILPLTGRTIPVIADSYVDKEFGTGCVKITPAHDPNDFEVGARHNLEQIIVMDEHGEMNERAGKDFNGMPRYEARKKIIEMLKEQNLLVHVKDHNHSVGHCYRCDTVIEPYLSDQWFVKMAPLAERAIEVVKNGKIKFQPERWIKVYLHWMENIRDWCISRQIWWGHRIPAYYTPEDEIIVAKSIEEAVEKANIKFNKNYTPADLRQDTDVLDTWFSSWLWPFSTMGWPEKTEDLNYFLPTNLLVTAPGIIYLWVARMIMATLEFCDKIPFDTVYLHGMVLDEQGRKMSKSLGNSPDPIHIIEEVGADALRFGMIFNTPKGQDSYYSANNLETGRNFANKIWNAYRYIMMNVEKIEGLPSYDEIINEKNGYSLELADKWIYSRLNQVCQSIADSYENIRFIDAAQEIMEFIRKDFCSWYLELSKSRIYNEEEHKAQQTAKFILLDVLQKSMKMLHPIMPFITEEIFQTVKKYFPIEEDAIIKASLPTYDLELINKQTDDDMNLIQEAISSVRNLRKQVNLPLSAEIEVFFKVTSDEQAEMFDDYKAYFAKLAKIKSFKAEKNAEKPKASIASVVRDIEIYLPLEGLIDIDAEKAKLEKQLAKLENELKRIEGKLANKQFVSKAPANIIAKEKEKQIEVKIKADKMRILLEGLK